MNAVFFAVLSSAAKAPPAKDVRAGWVAAVVLIALGVAVYFLLRSFVKQIKRVDFDEGKDPKKK